MLSHTPPKFTPGSYDPPMFNKRARAGSISGRLRSASDLCDEGIITPQEKGIIKDLIITGDPELRDVWRGSHPGASLEAPWDRPFRTFPARSPARGRP